MFRLHDTLAHAVREFQPAGPVVKLYVCGITPYDATHLGHAFTFVAFDVLRRYLRFRGHEVRYVQNVTDVDDPLFAKARELGINYEDLAERETAQYLRDMQDLNVLPPDVYPHASGEIPEMIAFVQRLLDGGHAYSVEGHVYFSIASDPLYGELSRLDRAAMLALARERGGDPDDPRRRDPLDFVLWRPSKPHEPALDSPWGAGLPGWHLECSTMALKYLGAPIDIHGGGADLVFPHHENEIAQAEGVGSGRPFANFWLHTGMVFLGGEKMSKSLGNMAFVRKLLPQYGADALRLYLSSCHYRAELHYDEAQVERGRALADRLAAAAGLIGVSGASTFRAGEYRDRFITQMDNDLDTPGAIDVLVELAEEIQTENSLGHDVAASQGLLRELGNVLGLRLGAPYDQGM